MQESAQQPLGILTPDEELRKQCLVWAVQTRALMAVPHMQVVNVAQEYYDFIRPQRISKAKGISSADVKNLVIEGVQ